MKAMSGIEHFARSGMADWAALQLSSKLDAMICVRVARYVTGLLCQTLCHAQLYLSVMIGVLGGIGAYDTLPGMVAITCVTLLCVHALGMLSPSAGMEVTKPVANEPKLDHDPKRSRDLCGGGGEATSHSVGSKAWLDVVLGVLKTRHLHPPVAQIRMLVADAQVKQRLEGAKHQKQQVDILCGAAFKAKLCWQQQSPDGPSAPAPTSSSGPFPAHAPPVPQWRLRAQDWQQCKPASTPVPLAPDGRKDAFRKQAAGDPMSLLWTRAPGVYCVDGASADRVLRSIPAHTPPAGLFTLITSAPTSRSEPVPVQVIVLHPDDTPHIASIYLTHIGVDKLCKVDFKELTLTSVDTVEVQLEWWADLCEGPERQHFQDVLDAQKAALLTPTTGLTGKGKGRGYERDKGKGKGKHKGVPPTVIMLINTHLKALVDSPGSDVFEAGQTSHHRVQDDSIRVCTRVTKARALEWLTTGLPSKAVIARDIIAFAELEPYRKVWLPDRSALSVGPALETMQSLRLALAGLSGAWGVIRTPARWGVRVHKNQEEAAKKVLQPHVVFVPDSHHKFCIRDLPREFDPESVVATLATDSFKPYLVSNLLTGPSSRKILFASPSEPSDIVFAIRDAGGSVHTVLLEKLPGPAPYRASATRHPEDSSPTRKTRRPTEPAPAGGAASDVRGGGRPPCEQPDHVPDFNKEFPALPSARVASLHASASSCAHSQGFPNEGNTCYVAVVLQMLLQLVSISALKVTQVIQHAPLRQVLASPGQDTWHAFLRALNLGGTDAQPEDAALFLESMIEPEPALQSHVELVEELSVECVGCGEARVLCSAELVHRVALPVEPTDLQSLLRTEFTQLAEEIEVSCPQCFAATAVPTARQYRPGKVLFIQLRRGGLHAAKNSVPVQLQSVELLGMCWEICAVVCHKGPQANDGHYVVMQADASQPHGWTLKDDALVRPASLQEVALMSTTCSILMLRPRTAAQTAGALRDPPGLPHPPATGGAFAQGPGPAQPAQDTCDIGFTSAPVACLSCQGVPLPDEAQQQSTCDHRPVRSAPDAQACAIEALRGEVQRLQQALLQPCQTCDAGSELRRTVCQLQSDVRAQQVVILSLERAVDELRHARQVAVEVSGGAVTQPVHSVVAEALSRSPPAVAEPSPAERLPSAKSTQSVGAALPSCVEGNFARSRNPALISEIAQLKAAGNSMLAFLVERLHADALLLPLAHTAADAGAWRCLGRHITYGKQEIQSRLEGDLITDQAVKWLVVRMLARGRYVRFSDLQGTSGWDTLRTCLLRACQVPSWWCPPWDGQHVVSTPSRSRRPLLPKEWQRSTRHARSTSVRRQTDQPAPASPRSRSRPKSIASLCNFWPRATTISPSACPVPDAATAATAQGQCSTVGNDAAQAAAPTHDVQPAQKTANAKKRRRHRIKADLKGGEPEVQASASRPAFRVLVANVTSLFSRVAAVCALGFSLAFLAETALTAKGQDILTMQLQKEGRCVVWSGPVEGAGVTSSRGVALLGGPGVRVEPLSVPEELAVHWRDGRLVAGKVRLGSTSQPAEVTCVACYADVYDVAARELLFEHLTSWLTTVHGHVLFGGDFNTDLDASPSLFRLLSSGYCTVNAGHEITCCAHRASRGSVIDHLLISPSLRPALSSGSVLSEAPFPTHRPVVADFEGHLVEDRWSALRLPRHFPVEGCKPTADAATRYASELARVQAFVDAGRPLEAYDAWVHLAEEDLSFACRRQGKRITDSHRGRAQDPDLQVCVPARLAGCALRGDANSRRLERARSGLAELCCRWDTCARQGTQHSIWANARRRVILVDDSLASLPTALPSLEQVRSVLDWLRAEINRRHSRERHSALSQWRASMMTSQAARFRWAKAKHARWQNVFDTPACFDALEKIWKPVLCRATGPAESRASVVGASPGVPAAGLQAISKLDLLSITGAELLGAAKHIPSRSACGADGWRRAELLALPLPLWDSLAAVLRGMTANAVWHQSLVTVVTSLIPKRDHVDFLREPGELRPISVASVVFRAWGSVLAKRLHAVLELSLSPSAHGFRAAESAQCAMSHTLLQCQNAKLSGRDLHFVTYDVRKCFDSLPWAAVESSLLRCGVGEATVAALSASWRSLRRIWKLQGRFQWASFAPRNGLFQGDPTAPACLAAFLIPPVELIRQRWPGVSVSQYADDVLLASSDATALHDAHTFFTGWLQEHGVELSIAKCKWASTAAEPNVPPFCVQRTRLERTHLLETLGGHFVLGVDPSGSGSSVLPTGCPARWAQLREEFFRVARRFGQLSVGWELRSADLAALLPALTYSAMAWCPVGVGSEARDRRTLVNILSGCQSKENTRRCVEVALALLSPVHRCSLQEGLLHEQVAVLFRLLNTNTEFRTAVRQHFSLCAARASQPNSFFSRFQAALGVYGWRWVEWDVLLDHHGVRHRMSVPLLETRRAAARAHLLAAGCAASLPRIIANLATEHASAIHALRAPVLHLLRDAMRGVAFQAASKRRRDMKGLDNVDRDLLTSCWARVPKADHPSLRFLMQGGAMTAARVHRATRGRTSSACSCCAPCEDECHRYWLCPQWSPLRAEKLGARHQVICAELARLGNVSAICGIPTHGLSVCLRDNWPAICACMVDIHRAATAQGSHLDN